MSGGQSAETPFSALFFCFLLSIHLAKQRGGRLDMELTIDCNSDVFSLKTLERSANTWGAERTGAPHALLGVWLGQDQSIEFRSTDATQWLPMLCMVINIFTSVFRKIKYENWE